MWGWSLATRFGRALGAVLAALAALAAAWFIGRRQRSAEIERERLQRYRTTRRRMDDADIGTGDAAADRERLRERAERSRGL